MYLKAGFKHVTATEARVRFGELMESVHEGEVVVVEKAGREMIALIPIERLPDLRPTAFDEKWWQRQDELAAEYRRRVGDQPFPDYDELIDVGRI